MKNVSLRADLAHKVRELAEIRCQNMIQVFRLMFNASDDEILMRMRAGLDEFQVTADFGRICLRMDDDTHQRLRRVADTQGYTINQLITMVLSSSDDTLLDYADQGINNNIEKAMQRMPNQMQT